MSDEQAVQAITIILAAYAEHFPQLPGKAVRPDLRDINHAGFARLLIEKLKRSQVRFFKEVSSHPLMLDSG